MTYKHDGDKYEVTVGEPRKVYQRETGPRGSYIEDADWQPGCSSSARSYAEAGRTKGKCLRGSLSAGIAARLAVPSRG
jgi:hypothetical protein